MPQPIQTFSAAETAVREAITQTALRALGSEVDPQLISIDYTPNSTFGDFTVPCFVLAKELKSAPHVIAESLVKNMSLGGLLDKAVAAGPYVNFYIDRAEFSRLALTEIHKAKDKFGRSKIGNNEKVMVEYFSPNTNKPLTIGHVRNICLGWSVSKLLQTVGYKVVTATLYNDRGIALAKTILGYKKWGKDKTPQEAKQKSDHFVGSFYVKFVQAEKEDPNLEKEAQRALQAWEEDKKEIKDLWLKLITWVLDGFRETLNRLRVGQFNEEYHESEYYREGKSLIEKGLKRGVFKQHVDGYVYADLEQFGLPNKILLRSNGTSLYVTQDIYLASLKNRHQVKRSIIISGSEQELQFKQLFKILELLQFENLKSNYHLSYGMIRLPEGKIKSREGLAKGTGADDVLDELETLAATEIIKRDPELSGDELKKRAADIALGALKFYILDVKPETTMTFSPEKSIAFTGRTGPYLQYVHARICSIFEKGGRLSTKVDTSVLNHELEFELIKRLSRFPSVVAQAATTYDPSYVANYLAEVAKIFSSFYEQLPVLQAEGEVKKARLLLIHDVRTVLANGLVLLGIPAPERM